VPNRLLPNLDIDLMHIKSANEHEKIINDLMASNQGGIVPTAEDQAMLESISSARDGMKDHYMKRTANPVKKLQGVITEPTISGEPPQNPEPKVKNTKTKIPNSLKIFAMSPLHKHLMQTQVPSATGQRVVQPSAPRTPTTVPKNSTPVKNSTMTAQAREFSASSIVTPEIEALLNNPDFLYNKNEREHLMNINSDDGQQLAQMSSMSLSE
jgi:hypothetical protein